MKARSTCHNKLFIHCRSIVPFLFWPFLVPGFAHSFVPKRSDASTRDLSSRKWNAATELMDYMDTLSSESSRKLPCGLDCTDSERAQAAALIGGLVDDTSNRNLAKHDRKLQIQDIVGTWNLVYTNSRTFSIVQSLNELEHVDLEFSKFAGLTMTLSENSAVEYRERVRDDDKPIAVSGDFQIQDAPNCCIHEHVCAEDGSSADEDFSLIDILYLDDSILVSRGNVNTNSVFVWKKQVD